MKTLAIVICAAAMELAKVESEHAVASVPSLKSALSFPNNKHIMAIPTAKLEANPRTTEENFGLSTPQRTKRQFYQARSIECAGVVCPRPLRQKRFIGIGFPGFGGFWPGLFGGLNLFGGLGGLGGLGGFPGGYPAACCCCYG
ncbi:unnamed protein product [Cylicocyclus nassatus]|uniref:Uncharacterized protein n=1 Tax=Cylicocyclus nassatus TaxID=53992 RepID=A0AA36H8L1_CYLNA|nr:unnamed protein product [Cylicocyclus nassatus]